MRLVSRPIHDFIRRTLQTRIQLYKSAYGVRRRFGVANLHYSNWYTEVSWIELRVSEVNHLICCCIVSNTYVMWLLPILPLNNFCSLLISFWQVLCYKQRNFPYDVPEVMKWNTPSISHVKFNRALIETFRHIRSPSAFSNKPQYVFFDWYKN